jgi:hypothetical protein
MILKIEMEREKVRTMMKDEVESMMRMGAELSNMTYTCSNTAARRLCITPKNMRQSYVADGSLRNIKCVHWIFYELPNETHKEVLPMKMSHMDLVVGKVERAMNIVWANKKEGETNNHRNCLQQTYTRVLNDKRQTVVNRTGTEHKRRPGTRCYKTEKEAKGNPHYKRNQKTYNWESAEEGLHWVSWYATLLE